MKRYNSLSTVPGPVHSFAISEKDQFVFYVTIRGSKNCHLDSAVV